MWFLLNATHVSLWTILFIFHSQGDGHSFPLKWQMPSHDAILMNGHCEAKRNLGKTIILWSQSTPSFVYWSINQSRVWREFSNYVSCCSQGGLVNVLFRRRLNIYLSSHAVCEGDLLAASVINLSVLSQRVGLQTHMLLHSHCCITPWIARNYLQFPQYQKYSPNLETFFNKTHHLIDPNIHFSFGIWIVLR